MRNRSTSLNRRMFPVDEWALIESGSGPSTDASDTLFAMSNGVFGLRTPIRTQRPADAATTIVNRFYETFPISYPEDAFGLARTGQSLIPGPDLSWVEIELNGRRLSLDAGSWTRTLDFRSGSLRRSFRLPTPSGSTLEVSQVLFVSQSSPGDAFQHWRIDSSHVDDPQPISLVFHIGHPHGDRQPADEHDPRRGRKFSQEEAPKVVLDQLRNGVRSTVVTRRTQQRLVTCLTTNTAHQHASTIDESGTTASFTITGVISSHDPLDVSLRVSVERTTENTLQYLDHYEGLSTFDFDTAFAEHQQVTEEFWQTSDINVNGHAEAQQAIRWHLFQLLQATPEVDGLGISAKGQTALGYDGHYFWDTEVFLTPFLSHCLPDRAQKVLAVRHSMLPEALQRAETLSQKGALFPWRTLSGEEASAYYPAGTAQYHINADIAWALHHYVRSTGDDEFLHHYGADIIIETARMWADLAFHGRDGAWHIYGVTGPDEYSVVVDDNAYTNAMAARNLRSAIEIVDRCNSSIAVPVTQEEREHWSTVADGLTIVFDDELGVYGQDAQFLSRPRMTLDDIPADQRPLLLHRHPLVIYRHQVTKQADIVLAMMLAPEAFADEHRRKTFEYYEQVTTGDSSLSSALQASAAAGVNHHDIASHHFDQALFLDLANTHQNTADGVHLANSGGVWTAVTCGMAGLNITPEGCSLTPTGWCIGDGVAASIQLQSSLIRLNIQREGTVVELVDGAPITFQTNEGEITVGTTPVFVPAVFPTAP